MGEEGHNRSHGGGFQQPAPIGGDFGGRAAMRRNSVMGSLDGAGTPAGFGGPGGFGGGSEHVREIPTKFHQNFDKKSHSRFEKCKL